MAEKKNEIEKVNLNVNLTAQLDSLNQFKAQKGQMIEGLEVVDSTDFKMPKIRLLQSNSQEVADGKGEAGQFYNTSTGKSQPEVLCALFILGKSRVKWPTKFKRGDEPECRSFDGKVKFDGSIKCDTCEYQDWEKAKAQGDDHPSCLMSYTWLGMTLDDSSPFRITMSGTSVSVTKNFINQVSLKGFPVFVYNVKISSEKVSNDKGIFYVARYDYVIGHEVATVEQAAERQTMSRSLSTLFQSAIEHDTSVIDVDVDGVGETTTGVAKSF